MYYNSRKREENKKKKGERIMNETRKEEITKRLEAIEEAMFYHNMADRWDFWEEKEVERLRAERANLINEMKEEKEEKKEEEKKEVFTEVGEGEFKLINSKERTIRKFESKEEAMNFYWKEYDKDSDCYKYISSNF